MSGTPRIAAATQEALRVSRCSMRPHHCRSAPIRERKISPSLLNHAALLRAAGENASPRLTRSRLDQTATVACRIFSTVSSSAEPQAYLFVPADFKVPAELKTANLLLKPLLEVHVDVDLPAVLDGMSEDGQSALQHVFMRNDSWPWKGITPEEDALDLRRHEAEFQRRFAFAYTVLDPRDEGRCLGCCYINPATRRPRLSDSSRSAAEVFYWIRASAPRSLEGELGSALRDWLRTWPFAETYFPGRDEDPWDEWEKAPFVSDTIPRIAEDAATVIAREPRSSGLLTSE